MTVLLCGRVRIDNSLGFLRKSHSITSPPSWPVTIVSSKLAQIELVTLVYFKDVISICFTGSAFSIKQKQYSDPLKLIQKKRDKIPGSRKSRMII